MDRDPTTVRHGPGWARALALADGRVTRSAPPARTALRIASRSRAPHERPGLCDRPHDAPGERDDLGFKIELGLVRRIERFSSRAALVTLFDGREFELRGSNDVNNENSGIIITDKYGDEIFVEWDDFAVATFDKP